VGQTIVFRGLPGCAAARFVGNQNRRAAQRFKDLVLQCAFAANPVRVPQSPVGQTIVFRGLPGCEAARFCRLQESSRAAKIPTF
jgi:hypothetical protein